MLLCALTPNQNVMIPYKLRYLEYLWANLRFLCEIFQVLKLPQMVIFWIEIDRMGSKTHKAWMIFRTKAAVKILISKFFLRPTSIGPIQTIHSLAQYGNIPCHHIHNYLINSWVKGNGISTRENPDWTDIIIHFNWNRSMKFPLRKHGFNFRPARWWNKLRVIRGKLMLINQVNGISFPMTTKHSQMRTCFQTHKRIGRVINNLKCCRNCLATAGYI
jgi:hypothetical protein